MRKLIVILLISIFMVLNGCHGNTNQTTISSGDTNSTTDEESWPVLPEYTGEALIEADPDREIYISLLNQDCDWYSGSCFGITFHLFTREPHPINEIQVSFLTEMKYEIEITDMSEQFRKSAYNGVSGLGFEYQHYLYLRRIDWREYGQLLLDKREAGKRIDAAHKEGSLDLEELKKWQEIGNQFTLKDQEYQADYKVMKQEDIPQYYVYHVSVRIDEPYLEEIIENVEINLSGKMYTIDFGQWRFHPKIPSNYLGDNTWVVRNKIATLANLCTPYTGGYVRIPGAFSFTASNDLTITGVRMYGADVELLGGNVTNGTGVDYYWNADQPINVSKGTDFNMDVYLYDELFAEYESACTVYLVMDYEVDGVTHSMDMPCLLARYNHPWDTCLMAFENYDMGEYYTYFWRWQMEKWVDEMPEGWSR